jgi:CobQ-like glutamine amidotransferase family enzyme
MKTINIAHLYYDLMNLNGEAGNIMALKSHFESQGLKVNISLLTTNDKIDFNKYDIYYMGSGSKENKLIVIDDILKYQNDIELSIKN